MPLSCSGLAVAYGGRIALEAFDLFVKPGEVRALIGPNGSGKSTALHGMAGLIKPSAGQVTIDGRSVGAMRRRALARHLAFLPQQPSAPDDMTVEQLVRHGRFAHVGLFGSYGRADEAAIRWALESTGLADLAQRSLRELSGGERQRAWISTAIAQEARILLLDEPTSFLDIGHQVEVLDLIHRLSREKGVSVVMAIHDLNQAMAIGDRISLLDEGRLVFDGPPADLPDTGLLETVFKVQGRFVRLETGGPPHFDVALARRRDRTPAPP